jgi:glucose dehydrogenase
MLLSRPVISGAIFALLGVYFAGAGTWLAVFGGTWYYAIAGAGLIATGVLLIMGRPGRLQKAASIHGI